MRAEPCAVASMPVRAFVGGGGVYGVEEAEEVAREARAAPALCRSIRNKASCAVPPRARDVLHDDVRQLRVCVCVRRAAARACVHYSLAYTHTHTHTHTHVYIHT